MWPYRDRATASLNDYDRQVPHSKLLYEAEVGNADYLRAVHRALGYVQYDPCAALAALAHGQVGFWRELVRLSRRPERDENGEFRIQILTDLLIGYRGPGPVQYDLFRAAFESLQRDGPLDWQASDEEIEADLCVALALHPPRPAIIQYMVDERQFRFKAAHLKLAQMTFSRALVGYARQHLHPDVADQADQAADPEPNECDLACMVMEAVKTRHVRCDCDCVVQVLVDYPTLIDKLFFFIEFLQEKRVRCQQLHQEAGGAGERPASSDSSDPDSDQGLLTATPFYRPEHAQSLIEGAVYVPGVVEGGTDPFLLLSAASSPERAPIEASSEPDAPLPENVPVWWIDQQLQGSPSHSADFIDDALFMSRLALISVDKDGRGLERWDQVVHHDGRRRRPGPCREPFQIRCVPNLVNVLSHWHQCLRELRSGLIR